MAIRIADEAIAEVGPRIEPGITEEAVAWELEKAMRERGAEMISFDTIVGAGPNGALPHHRADETVIQPNDAIVIDMGAKYQGYCSDLTRTVSWANLTISSARYTTSCCKRNSPPKSR